MWLVTVVFVLLGFLFALPAGAQVGKLVKDRVRPLGPKGHEGAAGTAGGEADPAQCVAPG